MGMSLRSRNRSSFSLPAGAASEHWGVRESTGRRLMELGGIKVQGFKVVGGGSIASSRRATPAIKSAAGLYLLPPTYSSEPLHPPPTLYLYLLWRYLHPPPTLNLYLLLPPGTELPHEPAAASTQLIKIDIKVDFSPRHEPSYQPPTCQIGFCLAPQPRHIPSSRRRRCRPGLPRGS